MSIACVPKFNPRPDLLFVIGIRDAVTELAERFCAEVGLAVHFAVKKSDPSQRIDSLDDDAIITPSLPAHECVFVCGLKASRVLCDTEGGPLDCNWTFNDASAFEVPLLSFLHSAAECGASVPADWAPKTTSGVANAFGNPCGLLAEDHLEVANCSNYPLGLLGSEGVVVADFGTGKTLWQLPQSSCEVLGLLAAKGR